MKVLGIIPAKRVSSRIKNKNIKKINNRYLIEYTILSSIKSKVFSNIIVSSDSLKVKNICNNYDLTFIERPKSISKKNSDIKDAILFTLNELYKYKINQPDLIIILEPTSPLRSVKTIKNVVNLFKSKKKINSILPISIKNQLIAIKYKNKLKFINHININNSIKRKSYFEVSSLIWAVRTKYFLKTKKIFDVNSFPFITNQFENFDINNQEDLKRLKNNSLLKI
tara:strand:+ start:54 stop:728 length:675 start_codon:yes stop_codon:yes gene_type:complete